MQTRDEATSVDDEVEYDFDVKLIPANNIARRKNNAVFYKIYTLAKEGKEEELIALKLKKSDFVTTYYPTNSDCNDAPDDIEVTGYPTFISEEDMQNADKLDDGMEYPSAGFRLAKEGNREAVRLLHRICPSKWNGHFIMEGMLAGGHVDWFLKAASFAGNNDELAEYIIEKGGLASESVADNTLSKSSPELAAVIKKTAGELLSKKEKSNDSQCDIDFEVIETLIYSGFKAKYLQNSVGASVIASVQSAFSSFFKPTKETKVEEPVTANTSTPTISAS